jgi:serine protease Do
MLIALRFVLLMVFSVSGLSPSLAALYPQEQDIVAAYEKASPSVVTVNALIDGHPSSGSGVIVNTVGLMVTSAHVVENCKKVLVTLANGQKYPGLVLKSEKGGLDLALIQIQTPYPLNAAQFGDSDTLKVGQMVLAIGNPYGFERTLTSGILSRVDNARNRLQTDAAINPGNSGGPLLNSQGDVIGINQSIYNPEGGHSYIGIGFAIPSNTVKQFLTSQNISSTGIKTTVATHH